MIAGAWLCLLAPLAGALAITLAGTRISRSAAAWISTGSVFVGFAGALVAFITVAGESPDERSHLSTAYTWLAAGKFNVAMQILVDPVSLTMMLIITGVGGLIIWYSMGYMKGEDEERRYFAYMALFVFSMLMLVMGGNLLLAARRLGARRARLLPADRLLPRPARGGRRRQEGVHHERDRRRRHGARLLPADRKDRLARLLDHVRRRLERRALVEHRESRRPRPARRRDRQVGPVAAPHVAPGRDGRTDAGLRPHPRGHDGDCRRLPDRANALDLRGGAGRPAPRRDHRCPDAARRRPRRARAVGHQARDRLLDDVADRLHVPRRRRRRLRPRHVPPDDPRLLQGAALPRRRHRDPSPRGRAGHPQDGRAAEADATQPRSCS